MFPRPLYNVSPAAHSAAPAVQAGFKRLDSRKSGCGKRERDSIMSSPSTEISSFQPRRRLFGYERKATDDFLEHVAELLEHAGKRLDQVEAELARHQEKEQSLNEALATVAKTADSIKHDARLEVEKMRMHARELEQFVTATRERLSGFLRETLVEMERIAEQTEARSRVEQSGEEQLLETPDTAREVIPPAEIEAKEDDEGATEEAGSLLERLRPYRVDASGGTANSPGS